MSEKIDSNWTKQPPTEAGAWQWRKGESSPIYIGIVRGGWFQTGPDCWKISDMGGEWLRLIPASELAAERAKWAEEREMWKAEVNEAWCEGRADAGIQYDISWSESRARRDSLGDEEPTL